VEEPCAERDQHRKAGQRQRRRLVDHLAEAVRVLPRAFNEEPIDRARRLPERENEQVAHDEREQHRNEQRQGRCERGLAGGRECRCLGRRLGCAGSTLVQDDCPAIALGTGDTATPVMYGPSTSGVAWPRGRTTTSRPSYSTPTRSASSSTST